MVTKEECIEALEHLKERASWRNVDDIVVFSRLITKHFDKKEIKLKEKTDAEKSAELIRLALENEQLKKALDTACDYLSDTSLIMITDYKDKLRRLTKEEWLKELNGW